MSGESRTYTIIGLMSGTSMDGVDAAILYTDGQSVLRPGATHFLRYPADFRARLRSVLAARTPVRDIESELTDYHIQAVQELLAAAGMKASAVDYVALHGHTILHDPAHKITRQIGDAQKLADAVKISVVYDFRSADVLAGGQGAPLVPIFHAALASGLPKPAAFVNIGGVSNITYVGAKDELLAFDCGPGNALMDDCVLRMNGSAHDFGGEIAARGVVDANLLRQWMDDPYFQKPFPKSLDRDHFREIVHKAMPQDLSGKAGENFLATLTEFTAEAIAASIKILPHSPWRVIITGGGRHNNHLMQRIENKIQSLPRVMPLESDQNLCRNDSRVEKIDGLAWDGDFIEAWAFAYLAARSVRGLPISFPTTTGVPAAMSGGKIVIKTA